MHNKQLARLLMVFTFIFLTAGAYILLPDQPKLEKSKLTPPNTAWSNVVTNTIVVDNRPITKTIAIPTASVETKNIEPPQVNTATTTLSSTIIINDTQYPLSLPEKSTAYDAMQALVQRKQISILMKEFSGIGYFVEEINGLKNNNQTGEYWIYYINDQSAKVGISAYTLKQNDKITWKYEHSKF